MTDEELGEHLARLQEKLSKRTLTQEDIDWHKANKAAIDAYFKRRYYELFDLCPSEVRTLINTSEAYQFDKQGNVLYREGVPLTRCYSIREAFSLCSISLEEWCSANNLSSNDISLDLMG